MEDSSFAAAWSTSPTVRFWSKACAYTCRHLEIGRDAHKLIDAKVKEGNLELVSEPFQFGKSMIKMSDSMPIRHACACTYQVDLR